MTDSTRGDGFGAAGMERYLRTPGLSIRFFPVIGSTNTELKIAAQNGAPEGTVYLAGEQTAGRGRMGRSFYSPDGTGLYMSLLLRPASAPAECGKLTACAAVAAAEAIESVSGRSAGIKWVNDILLDGRKVCGILAEAGSSSGRLDYAVIGLGVNVFPPRGGFPPELSSAAGAVFGGEPEADVRCRLAAAILDAFMAHYRAADGETVYREYRRRSVVIGREIRILAPGSAPETALALDIGRDFALCVRTAAGDERRLTAGEISIRPAD